MLNSEEARKLSVESYLEKIQHDIISACENGDFSASLPYSVNNAVKNALEELGYFVSVSNNRKHMVTTIRWDVNDITEDDSSATNNVIDSDDAY